jgi:hypothetical protein
MLQFDILLSNTLRNISHVQWNGTAGVTYDAGSLEPSDD